MDFDEFVLARRPAMLRLAFLLCGDAHLAEDLVQTALVKAFRRWRLVQRSEWPDAYVRRILLTSYLDWRRKLSSQERPVEHPDSSEPPADQFALLTDRDELFRALGDLPRRQRAVVVLRYFDDLDDHSIADILGVREGTVRSQAARALSKLRVALLDEAHLNH